MYILASSPALPTMNILHHFLRDLDRVLPHLTIGPRSNGVRAL
jgi:hypothetical protein